MRFATTFALLFSFLIASITWANEDTLRKGDQIVIDIKGVPQDEREQVFGTYTISDEGVLELYLIGGIRAIGEKPSTLATLIEQRYLQGGYYTQANVLVTFDKAQGGRYVTLMGELGENGAIRFTEGLTLMEAISMSGGFTEFANVNEVKLIRNSQARVHDCAVIVNKPEMDVAVLPGDKIFVPQRDSGRERRRTGILNSFRR